jgi:hypothetical protein
MLLSERGRDANRTTTKLELEVTTDIVLLAAREGSRGRERKVENSY